jgi:hypothetical protein
VPCLSTDWASRPVHRTTLMKQAYLAETIRPPLAPVAKDLQRPYNAPLVQTLVGEIQSPRVVLGVSRAKGPQVCHAPVDAGRLDRARNAWVVG